MLTYSDNIRIVAYICNHSVRSYRSSRHRAGSQVEIQPVRTQGRMTEQQRRIVAYTEPPGVTGREMNHLCNIYKNFTHDTLIVGGPRVPMYSTSMCLRLLYLVPLIGITGTPYALADPTTPLHVVPDQIHESACLEFRETPEDAKQTETLPAPEEPPSSNTPSTTEADPQAAKLAPQDVLEELADLRKALLLEPRDDSAPRLRVAHVLYQLGDRRRDR